MKNIKIGLFMMVLTIVTLSFTGCGGEDEEPQPAVQKTDLELVQEGIIGNWNLKSIVVTKGSVTETFNGGCDETGLSDFTKANVEDIDFNFTSGTNVTLKLNCQTKTVDVTYTVSEVDHKFYIATSNGFKFELTTAANDVNGSSVNANIVTPKLLSIDNAVWTFSK